MHQTDNPQKTMLIAKHPDVDETGLHCLFKMRREGVRLYLEHIDAQPSEQLCIEAASVLSEMSQTGVSLHFMQQLLVLYPQMRIKLAMAGDVGDTDIRENLVDTLAHFLLGCTWPTYGDEVDMEEFMALIKKQAFLLREGL